MGGRVPSEKGAGSRRAKTQPAPGGGGRGPATSAIPAGPPGFWEAGRVTVHSPAHWGRGLAQAGGGCAEEQRSHLGVLNTCSHAVINILSAQQ